MFTRVKHILAATSDIRLAFPESFIEAWLKYAPYKGFGVEVSVWSWRMWLLYWHWCYLGSPIWSLLLPLPCPQIQIPYSKNRRWSKAGRGCVHSLGTLGRREKFVLISPRSEFRKYITNSTPSSKFDFCSGGLTLFQISLRSSHFYDAWPIWLPPRTILLESRLRRFTTFHWHRIWCN